MSRSPTLYDCAVISGYSHSKENLDNGKDIYALFIGNDANLSHPMAIFVVRAKAGKNCYIQQFDF